MKWLPQTNEPKNNANLCQFKSHREVGQPGHRDFVDNGRAMGWGSKLSVFRRGERKLEQGRWFNDRVIDEIFAEKRKDNKNHQSC